MSDLNDLLPSDFNPTTVAAESGGGDYDPLPAGWYSVHVERTEMKDTKRGDGSYLSVALVVDGPRGEGRWIFDTFNLKNPSAVAVGIAIESFAKLCVAVGINGRPKHMSELQGKRLDVKLKIKRSTEYGDGNEVAGYAPAGSKAKTGGITPGAAAAVNNFSDDVPF